MQSFAAALNDTVCDFFIDAEALTTATDITAMGVADDDVGDSASDKADCKHQLQTGEHYTQPGISLLDRRVPRDQHCHDVYADPL